MVLGLGLMVRAAQAAWASKEVRAAFALPMLQTARLVRVLVVLVVKVFSTLYQLGYMGGSIGSRDSSRGCVVGCPNRRHVVQSMCNWCLSVGVMWPGVDVSKLHTVYLSYVACYM